MADPTRASAELPEGLSVEDMTEQARLHLAHLHRMSACSHGLEGCAISQHLLGLLAERARLQAVAAAAEACLPSISSYVGRDPSPLKERLKDALAALRSPAQEGP